MMVIVNVVQATVRPCIRVRRGGFAGYSRADMMMVHAGVSGQASRRASVVMTGQRCSRKTAIGVDRVPVNRRRTAVIQHARIR